MYYPCTYFIYTAHAELGETLKTPIRSFGVYILMSEKEDGEGSAIICRRRPSRRSLELNDLMDYLDRRAYGLVLFIEASKEAACFGLSGVTAYS